MKTKNNFEFTKEEITSAEATTHACMKEANELLISLLNTPKGLVLGRFISLGADLDEVTEYIFTASMQADLDCYNAAVHQLREFYVEDTFAQFVFARKGLCTI